MRPTTTKPVAAASATTEARWSRDEQAAIDAYLALVEAAGIANSDPVNPDLPALRELAAPELLQEIQARIIAKRQLGLASRPDTTFTPSEVTVEDGTARIEGCTVDRTVVYVVASGEVVNDEVEVSRTVARLRREGDRWVVTSSTRTGEPCDA